MSGPVASAEVDLVARRRVPERADGGPATLTRIDAAAKRTGLSRNVLLRELLIRYAGEQESGALTDQQVEALGSSVRDLLEDDTRAAAWRR